MTLTTTSNTVRSLSSDGIMRRPGIVLTILISIILTSFLTVSFGQTSPFSVGSAIRKARLDHVVEVEDVSQRRLNVL